VLPRRNERFRCNFNIESDEGLTIVMMNNYNIELLFPQPFVVADFMHGYLREEREGFDSVSLFPPIGRRAF
jgi:hypothetical protein